jgi:hypothetical protein
VVNGAWLMFALWSHLERGLSTFFVTLDSFARQALKPREYWEGVVVGGLICLALAAFILGNVYHVPEANFVALACLFASVANAAAFTNDHHLGGPVYTLAAAVSGLGAVYCGIATFAQVDLPFAGWAGIVALLIGVVTTWLRPFRVLYA